MKNNKFVYAILWGNITDISIQGIYSTYEKAEEVLKTILPVYNPYIEAWEIDNADGDGSNERKVAEYTPKEFYSLKGINFPINRLKTV